MFPFYEKNVSIQRTTPIRDFETSFGIYNHRTIEEPAILSAKCACR